MDFILWEPYAGPNDIGGEINSNICVCVDELFVT